MAQRFEDFVVWQKARVFTNEIYRAFSLCKDYSFCDQVQRATISIMNNIAEGSERQTAKELRQFLFIAKGSSGEVRSMLYMASDLGYISIGDFEKLTSNAEELSKMLAGFVKKLQN